MVSGLFYALVYKLLVNGLSDDSLVELYCDGESCAAIARRNNCSETLVYNRLKDNDVKMRSRSEANKVCPDFILISLYNVGLSSSQVGRLLRIDSSTVTKRLHTMMFPLRSRNVASRIRYTEDEFKRNFMVPQVLDLLDKFVCSR